MGHAVVLIDEPDAYLHPHLSRRLALALERAVGPAGQLIMATHSSTILDTVPTSGIVRLAHQEAPRLVADEEERLEVYREVGFRASALTQSDFLLVTEGDFDAAILPLLLPELARASVKSTGGRHQALADVARLAPYSIPVIGVVDADVLAPAIPTGLETRVVVWETADIEGMLLADDATLEVMVARGLSKSPFLTVEALRGELDALLAQQHDNFLAEAAQRLLRTNNQTTWPSPKGDNPVERLRAAVGDMIAPTEQDLERRLTEAEALWQQHEGAHTLWKIVRGKYIAGAFAESCSHMRSASALLESVARAQPDLQQLARVKRLLQGHLG